MVADDLVAVGLGDTQEKTTVVHDQYLEAFLQWCKEKGVKMNPEKM